MNSLVQPPRFIWEVSTPLSWLPNVSLKEAQWTGHIIDRHGEMAGKEVNVQVAVSAPTCVVAGNPGTNCVVFVNHSDAMSNGSPIAVVVGLSSASVVTALYHRRYATVTTEEVLWVKP